MVSDESYSRIRAHQHAAGASGGPEKDGSEEEALGRRQGGFGTKVHIRAEGNGRLMRLLLTSGQRNESTVFERLLEGASVRRRGPGRPRQ